MKCDYTEIHILRSKRSRELKTMGFSENLKLDRKMLTAQR